MTAAARAIRQAEGDAPLRSALLCSVLCALCVCVCFFRGWLGVGWLPLVLLTALEVAPSSLHESQGRKRAFTK